MSRADGVLTAAEMSENQQALLRHPRFNVEFRRIYNLTEITDLAVSADEMRRMPFPYAPGAKRALVAENDMVYGMARMYQMMREEQHQGALHVYRTLAEGLEWVGLELAQYREISDALTLSPDPAIQLLE